MNMNNTTFKHQPLGNPAESIRLVHIIAQQIGPSLELCLSTHSVADNLPYFAISYTWGDGILAEDISINGRPTKVTKNCLYALEQINRRYPSDYNSREPTYLWIDSICINQADNDEKGHQVAMMGNIYAKATKVLACIGPEESKSAILRTVLDYIKIHDPRLYADRQKLRSGWWSRLEGWEKKIGKLLQSYPEDSTMPKDEFGIQFHWACFRFANRSYWSRVWIIQEFTAPDRSGNDLEILCGYDSFSKAEINLCFYIASYIRTENTSAVKDYGLLLGWPDFVRPRSFTTIMRFDASKPVPLGNILFNIGDLFHCTKPEDRVYGLLPLVEWPGGMPPIQPAYKPSSTLELAQLMISVTDEDPQSCRAILEALELYHDNESLKTLVEARTRIQDSHGMSNCGVKYPFRASYDVGAAVLPLHRNTTGQLSASLYCDTNRLCFIVDLVAERAAILNADRSIHKPQKLFAGSRIAGLLCSEAREGDVMVKRGPGSIIVLRSSNCDGLYSLVGQGLLCYGFYFPLKLPPSTGLLERKLERVEKDIDYSEGHKESLTLEMKKATHPGEEDLACLVELRAEPIEWLIFVGQDLSKDQLGDKESRLKRLYTKLYMEATIV